MATGQEKIDQLREKLAKVELGGGQKRIDSQHKKGKLTARERLAKLFDEGSFTEMGQFIHHRGTHFGLQEKEIPGDGVVTGYGTVRADWSLPMPKILPLKADPLVKCTPIRLPRCRKWPSRWEPLSLASTIPAAPRIQEGIDALSGFGRIFMNNTSASGVIPQLAVIMGPCAGGAVYSPALMDFVFMVKNTSNMFLTGPAVIKSVTAEEVTAEELGGAMTHNSISGVAHFACESEDDCFEKIKALLDFLPSNNMEEAPVVDSNDDPNREDESLNSIIPDDNNVPYDMLDIIRSCVDDGNVFQVLENYALNIITCFARFDGQTVGIIANQPKFLAGCLDINASDKAARFIRFCDSFNIPVVTFVDVPGFLPGTNQEYGGIIRHGAKMLYAYCEATVPKITVVTRKAYGGAYIAMCCRQLGADMVMAWPSAEIAVMGPDGAVNIIFKNDPDKEKRKQEYIDEFLSPYKAAEHGQIDCIIEPKETRPRIISALAMLYSKREERPAKKHGNMPL